MHASIDLLGVEVDRAICLIPRVKEQPGSGM